MLEHDLPLFKELLSLPPLKRLQLVDFLLESLDMPDSEIEESWANEVASRWEGYKSGAISSVLADELFDKYQS